VQTVSVTEMQIICSLQRDEIVYVFLDIICTVHFVDFIILVQQMYSVFVNNYLLLIALLHVSMFPHHLQGISCVC